MGGIIEGEGFCERALEAAMLSEPSCGAAVTTVGDLLGGGPALVSGELHCGWVR